MFRIRNNARHPRRVHHSSPDDTAPNPVPAVNYQPPTPTYTYLLAEEERGRPLSDTAKIALRKQLAETLSGVGRTVQTYVEKYIATENLSYSVQPQARVHTKDGWGQWGDASAVNLDSLDHTPNPRFDADFTQTVPALQYRIGVTSSGEPAPLLRITVNIDLVVANEHVVARQIRIGSDKSDDAITLELFGQDGVMSFAALKTHPPQILSTNPSLLRMCDTAIIKHMFKNAELDSNNNVFIRFDVEKDSSWPASLFSDNFESRTIRTRLRKSASDRYFLEATEMSNERDKKSRTFATATEFITWASNPRIKDPKTIRLTKHNPDLLTLATLARVLDVLDG